MRLPAGTVLVVYEHGRPNEAVSVDCDTGFLPEGIIQETRMYIFELQNVSVPDQAELFIDGVALEALRSPNKHTARWRWTPGFHAGVVTLTLLVPGYGRSVFEVSTDPDLRKLTRSDFDLMVREILEDSYALFSLSHFRYGLAKGVGTDVPPIARLEFLRSRIDAIESAVRAISSRPIRFLRNETAWVENHQARAITSPELVRSFRGARVMHSESARRPAVLKGFWPARINKTIRMSGYDIPEHRAIKTALRRWSEWMYGVAESLRVLDEPESGAASRLTWAKTCRTLALRLRKLLALVPFNEVPDSQLLPTASPVFLKVPAYRRFFTLHHEMELGITNISGEFLNLPLARTFELYELWAFLRIARAAAHLYKLDRLDTTELFRATARRDGLVLVSGSPILQVTPQLAFAFKRNYREYWVERERIGSFSRTMQPDVTIRIGNVEQRPPQLIVLDAKYRINEQLSSALASIHMYRDALVEEEASGGCRRVVAGAYLLTPHQPLGSSHWRESDMPNRLFHPEYRADFRFGAVTLRPGHSLEAIIGALESILQDSGIDPPSTKGSF